MFVEVSVLKNKTVRRERWRFLVDTGMDLFILLFTYFLLFFLTGQTVGSGDAVTAARGATEEDRARQPPPGGV